MTPLTHTQILQQGYNCLLFDAALLPSVDSNLFQPDWLQQHAELHATTSGRGQSWFVNFRQQNWVLRHYLRGGMVSRFNRDMYFSWQPESTRAWKEWRLLQHMRALQLPVPRPVAARAYWPAGRHTGFYRADILLETIANCTTLSAMLQHQAVPATIWHNIGRCIKAFHQQQIYHADLNANNILVDTQQKIHLIDFDRCRITSRQNLLASNLPRLQRSLLKLQTLHQEFQFKSPDWQTLMASYNDNSAA